MEFIDLKAQYRAYQDEINTAIRQVIDNAEFIGGHYVDLFEKELATYVGRRHCIACGNGTDALQLAYMALEVGPGDAIFCPDMTFIASVEPAVMLGATPIFCDIDPLSYNLSPADLERQILRVKAEGILHPKAVVVVDFLGNPADYDRLQTICCNHGLELIEDAAQGIGGTYKGKHLGSFGHIATTSFFPSKPLGCYGDGGAVFTDDGETADLLRSLHIHGKGETKYDNVRIGVNSRLDNLQAAILHIKLSHLEEEMEARQRVAQRYDEALGDAIQCPYVERACRSAFAQYVLLADSVQRRDHLKEVLEAQGIPSIVYYPNLLHTMKAFHLLSSDRFPISSDYATRNFGLPFSPFLIEEDQDKVIEAIQNAFSKKNN